jgi:hypothetical protein
MQAVMPMKHVVIDGSNMATEGREAPSLAQLDEAVRAFIDEYQPEVVTVVVDATFPNRIEPEERQVYEDAVAANELITPPAGAVGRGDAFVLQIARRADAAILSNDSFQEFHGDYPWLFEPGRLIGGKPVPRVGWVFMERVPVRGPASRRAVSEARKAIKATKSTKATKAAKRAKAAEPAPEVAKEVAPPEPGEAAEPKRRRARAPATSDGAARAEPTEPAPTPAEAAGDGRGDAAGRAARDVAAYNEALPFIEFIADHPVGSEVDATVERFSSHGAYVMSGDARGYVPLRNLADPAPRSAREVLQLGEARRFVVVAIDPPRRGIDLALPGVVEVPAGPTTSVEEQVVEALVAPEVPEPELTAAVKKPARRSRAKQSKAAVAKPGAKRTAKEAAAKATPARARAKTAAKTSAARTAAKAVPAKKGTAKRSPAKKTPARKTPAKKTAPRKVARKSGSAGGDR